MKRKIISAVLAMCMLISCINIAYAENSDNNGVAENTENSSEDTSSELESEALSEAPTQAPAEEATEAPTEAATSAVTNNNNKYSDERKDIKLTIKRDDGKSLSSYVTETGLSASDFDWTSSDTNMITVNSNGYAATEQNLGSCTITAVAVDGSIRYTYYFDIIITNYTDEDEKKVEIYVDDTKDLYRYVDSNYSAKDYEWESDDTRIVTVSSKGVISGKRKGRAEVTAVLNYGSRDLRYTFKITVDNDDDNDDVNSSRYSSSKVAKKTTWTIYVGTDDEVDISDILEDSPDDYDWDVRDNDIAEIDEDNGIIRGIDEGSTRIDAEGDTDYTFTVKVANEYYTEEMSIRGAKTESLEDYLREDIDEYDFESDRRDVAKVDSDGDVTGVANGIATIICEHEDGDIVQVFVTVSGITSNKTTTITTRETSTETTTARQVTQATTIGFTDISHRSWAVNAIKNMASKGIILGIGNNKFAPDSNCKRADCAIMLTKVIGIDNISVASNYSDVKPTDYFYKYVGAAKEKKIESGVKDNQFRPNSYITREEMMVMVYKGLEEAQGTVSNKDTTVLSKYTDSNQIAPENKEAIAALINKGIVAGTSATTLSLKSNMTRAQIAVIMEKFYNEIN